MKSFKDLGIVPDPNNNFIGNKIEMDSIINCEIIVHKYAIKPSKSTRSTNPNCLYLQIEFNDEYRVTWKGSQNLMQSISKIKPEDFPFKTTIIKEAKGGYHFT